MLFCVFVLKSVKKIFFIFFLARANFILTLYLIFPLNESRFQGKETQNQRVEWQLLLAPSPRPFGPKQTRVWSRGADKMGDKRGRS